MSAAAALEQGLADLGLVLQAGQRDQCLAYLALIGKWNQVYNLTAVRQSEQMLTHHLLDCLAGLGPLQRHLGASGLLQGGRLLDVGSGAGLPGIVWAIGCPQLQVCCVDTVAKKAAFITQAGLTLGLKNLKGVHARVESLSGPFDVISSRAFASLPDFVAGSSQALGEGGVWLAMKGKHPADEIAAVPADVFHVEPLQVPGLSAERCLVWMRPRPAQSNPG
jgi:16S rRNA (guanine527-N7)-methyltransferase